MSGDDLLLLGMTVIAVFLFAPREQTTVLKVGPTTPQGSSYPACPPGQAYIDVGDLAPDWICSASYPQIPACPTGQQMQYTIAGAPMGCGYGYVMS